MISQLQRSKDNAAEIGLYPPRGATGFRHENRHHISMFDRGHPRAVEDEHQSPVRAIAPHHLAHLGQMIRPEQLWAAGYPPSANTSPGLPYAQAGYGGPVGYASGYPPAMYAPRSHFMGLGISNPY